LWFAGKPQDRNTGLSYFGARYYDPLVGRFMGIDLLASQTMDDDFGLCNLSGRDSLSVSQVCHCSMVVV
ncbi:MAG: hypothetical protein LBJ59_04230, partial [Zoogloeaceae bacterium]|nr:hypothetical protein [Zoogloeaceae bacterium]